MAAGGHDKLLSVTRPASCRNIYVTDPRLRITRWKQFVRTTVTVRARRCFPVSGFDRFRVITTVVGCLLIGVAGGTGYLGWRIFVRRRVHVSVALNTGKHSAVDRGF